MKISVLGTEYDLVFDADRSDAILAAGPDFDGYCDDSVKRIVVFYQDAPGPGDKRDLAAVRRKVVRHEIVHAFLFESGLDAECYWAQNEELIDWLALQGPKLAKAWQEAGVL